MKYITLCLVVAGLYACSPNPLYHAPGAVCANGVPADSWQCSNTETPAQRELRERRIDWSAVPEVGPYKAPAAPTPTQRALKRGARDGYTALQFEREKTR